MGFENFKKFFKGEDRDEIALKHAQTFVEKLNTQEQGRVDAHEARIAVNQAEVDQNIARIDAVTADIHSDLHDESEEKKAA